MNKVLGLLDLDPLVYSCAFAAQHKRYILKDDQDTPLLDFRVKQFGSKDWRAIDQDKKNCEEYATAYSRKELIEATRIKYGAEEVEEYIHVDPASYAINMAKSQIQAVIRSCECTEFQGVISIGDCFRHGIATLQKYKGNRDGFVKPVHYGVVKKYFLEQWNAIPSEFYEADDYMSIQAHRSPDTVVIASIDKDLQTVPGWHYVHSKNLSPEDRLFETTFEQSMTKFMEQLLTGDKADNIPGIKGVGPKTSEKILDKPTLAEKFQAVCEKYEAFYGDDYEYEPWQGGVRNIDWKDAINEVGKLLWMVRDPQEPLWNIEFFKQVIGDENGSNKPSEQTEELELPEEGSSEPP